MNLDYSLEELYAELAQILTDSYKEILNELIIKMEKGLSTYYLQGLLNDIDLILAKLASEVESWTVRALNESYDLGKRYAAYQLKTSYPGKVIIGDPVIASIGASFTMINMGALVQSILDTYKDIASATTFMGEALKQALRDASKGIFRSSMVTMNSLPSISLKLRHELIRLGFSEYIDRFGRRIKLSEFGEYVGGRNIQGSFAGALLTENWTGFIDARGVPWDLKFYCDTLVRTKTAELVSRGTESQLLSQGLDLVKIVGPTEVVDWCGEYRGKVFSITGNSIEFPPLSETPSGGTPFHPNCKDREAPFVPHFHSKEEIEAAKIDAKWIGLNKGDGYADQTRLRKQYSGR